MNPAKSSKTINGFTLQAELSDETTESFMEIWMSFPKVGQLDKITQNSC